MTKIFETSFGAFECVLTPDLPGPRPRTLAVRQLSGRPLTRAEWEHLAAHVVEYAGALGVDVTWTVSPPDPGH